MRYRFRSKKVQVKKINGKKLLRSSLGIGDQLPFQIVDVK